MDQDYEADNDQGYSFFPIVFRAFVCVALSVLLGMNMYAYFWGHPLTDSIDGDFTDIKYMVMQLTRGLTEVNRKHERLQTEMERISSSLPGVAAAAGRAREALQPSPRGAGEQALNIYDYDRQIIDYALESAGGKVIDTGNSVDHMNHESVVGWTLYLLTLLVCRSACPGARAMLQPGTLPGQCWAFKGSKGEATIRLLGTVHVTGFSLEHIQSHISPTRETSSAPRLVNFQGLEHKNDLYPYDFGTFEYENDGKPIQYFEVKKPAPKGHNLVRIRILTNWGHPVYTCVYRVRVHGNLAPGQGHKPLKNDDDTRVENE